MAQRIAIDALFGVEYIPCLFVENLTTTMYLCVPTELDENDVILLPEDAQTILTTRGLFSSRVRSDRTKFFENLVFEFDAFKSNNSSYVNFKYVRIVSSTLFHFVWYETKPRVEKFVVTNKKHFANSNKLTMPTFVFESEDKYVGSFFDLNMYIIHSNFGYYSNIPFTDMSAVEANELNLITRLQEIGS